MTREIPSSITTEEYSRGMFFLLYCATRYLDELPRSLESSCDTNSITLPNGLPVCLFYAHDLILISSSAAGFKRQLNILLTYSEKWLLKINLKKTKTSIFQKQNRRSTHDKFSWHNSYHGITFITNGNFANPSKKLNLTQHSCSLCKH